MLFTIAIPTYNSAKLIEKAIISCLKIKYNEEFEILIVNNNSNDNTLEILEKFSSEKKIRIINNEKTVSQFENHNVCLKEARGDYIIFCHSDDELKEDILEILKFKIESRNYPEKYIVWGQSMFRDFYGYLKQFNVTYNTIIAGERAIEVFSIPNGLTPSGTCYSRKALLEIGGFYEMKTKTTPSDWTIMLNAAINEFEFEMLDRLLFIRKFASTALSESKNNRKKDIFDAFNIVYNNLNLEEREIIKKFILKNINYEGYYILKKFFKLKLSKKLKYFFKGVFCKKKELVKLIFYY